MVSLVGTIVSCIFVIFNSVCRLAFPSRYVPAAQKFSGFFRGPLFARLLATGAEICFYFTEALCLKIPFCGPFGFLVILGEIICWSHVLLQSELLGWIEDILWVVVQLYALFSAIRNRRISFIICIPFVVYMSLAHLPRMSKRIKKPFFDFWHGSELVDKMDKDTLLWTVPSLILQVAVFSLFLWGSMSFSCNRLNTKNSVKKHIFSECSIPIFV
jgi:hypothetical protein